MRLPRPLSAGWPFGSDCSFVVVVVVVVVVVEKDSLSIKFDHVTPLENEWRKRKKKEQNNRWTSSPVQSVSDNNLLVISDFYLCPEVQAGTQILFFMYTFCKNTQAQNT